MKVDYKVNFRCKNEISTKLSEEYVKNSINFLYKLNEESSVDNK